MATQSPQHVQILRMANTSSRFFFSFHHISGVPVKDFDSRSKSVIDRNPDIWSCLKCIDNNVMMVRENSQLTNLDVFEFGSSLSQNSTAITDDAIQPFLESLNSTAELVDLGSSLVGNSTAITDDAIQPVLESLNKSTADLVDLGSALVGNSTAITNDVIQQASVIGKEQQNKALDIIGIDDSHFSYNSFDCKDSFLVFILAAFLACVSYFIMALSMTKRRALRKEFSDESFISALESNVLEQLKSGSYREIIDQLENHDLQKIIQICGQDHSDTAFFYHILAKCYIHMDDAVTAERYLKDVVRLYDKQFHEDSLMAHVFEDLGTAFFMQQRLDEALNALYTALRIFLDDATGNLNSHSSRRSKLSPIKSTRFVARYHLSDDRNIFMEGFHAGDVQISQNTNYKKKDGSDKKAQVPLVKGEDAAKGINSLYNQLPPRKIKKPLSPQRDTANIVPVFDIYDDYDVNTNVHNVPLSGQQNPIPADVASSKDRTPGSADGLREVALRELKAASSAGPLNSDVLRNAHKFADLYLDCGGEVSTVNDFYLHLISEYKALYGAQSLVVSQVREAIAHRCPRILKLFHDNDASGTV